MSATFLACAQTKWWSRSCGQVCKMAERVVLLAACCLLLLIRILIRNDGARAAWKFVIRLAGLGRFPVRYRVDLGGELWSVRAVLGRKIRKHSCGSERRDYCSVCLCGNYCIFKILTLLLRVVFLSARGSVY